MLGNISKDILELLSKQLDPALLKITAEQLKEMLSGQPRLESGTGPSETRWQDRLIQERIPRGASVLDLGCGNGQLLLQLMQGKQVRGQGIELASEAVFQCVEKGVPVFQSDLDQGLKGLADQSFDYVVLEETVQTLHRPVQLLEEMLRVGKYGIVSFPNFGHWRVRLDVLIQGRMPVTPTLPYRWYNTPNIHLLTLQDFLQWTQESRVKILEAHALAEGEVRPLTEGDNLYAEEALLVLQKG